MFFLFQGDTPGEHYLSLMPAIFGLVGTVIGGLISFAATRWAEHNKALRERNDRLREYEALAKAIAAEIETTLRMFRFRNARGHVDQFLMAARAGYQQFFLMDLGENNFPITRSCLGKVGHLAGDIPPLLAELVTLTNALKLDLDLLRRMKSLDGTPPNLVHFYEQMLAIIDRGMEVGEQVVREIAKHYPGYVPAPWNRPSASVAG